MDYIGMLENLMDKITRDVQEGKIEPDKYQNLYFNLETKVTKLILIELELKKFKL